MQGTLTMTKIDIILRNIQRHGSSLFLPSTSKRGTICKTLYHAAEKHITREYDALVSSKDAKTVEERGEKQARRPSVYERSTIRRMLSTRNCQWCSNSLPTTSRLSALTMLQQPELTITNNVAPSIVNLSNLKFYRLYYSLIHKDVFNAFDVIRFRYLNNSSFLSFTNF